MKTLPLLRTAPEHVMVLDRLVIPRLPGHLEMRLNHIGHIPERQSRPLLAVLVHVEIQPRQIPALHRAPGFARRDLRPHLVAPDILEPDRVENMKPVDLPTDRGLPVDRFENAPRRRGRDHIIAHPLDLHLRSRETGIIAPHL